MMATSTLPGTALGLQLAAMPKLPLVVLVQTMVAAGSVAALKKNSDQMASKLRR